MEDEFNRILDECIDRVNRGETIKACLDDHPEQAARLEPLLEAAARTASVYAFTPEAATKHAARQRFYAALDKQARPSFWRTLFARRVAWVTMASVLVILVAGYLALRATEFSGIINPGGTSNPGSQNPPLIVAAPAANGNFAFLVSDDVNAIADFSELHVTLDKVELSLAGTPGGAVEFVPQVNEFDLTLLPGAATQELWRGDVPEGDYRGAVLYIASVKGTLKSSGRILEIKVPSNKLKLDTRFSVSAGNLTSFTYDLTVVRAGNAKYLLKPQAGESGASQAPLSEDGKNNGQSGEKPGDKTKVPSPSPKKQPDVFDIAALFPV